MGSYAVVCGHWGVHYYSDTILIPNGSLHALDPFNSFLAGHLLTYYQFYMFYTPYPGG